jgi:hypothetical protein
MRWRTTSRLVRADKGYAFDRRRRTRSRSARPERPPGRSTWVISPLTTTLDPKPILVRNIFNCSGVAFCASSKMMKLLIQRPAPHIGQRCHLDGPVVQQAASAFGPQHVVEGIVEGAQVRVDLGHEVAGQEAQPLPRFDRRPGHYYALHRFGLERLDGQSHRQIALAGPRGADAKGNDVRTVMAST